MTDYSQYSDVDLMQMAGIIPPDAPQPTAKGADSGGNAFTATPVPQDAISPALQQQITTQTGVTAPKDYSQYSDADLMKMAGITPQGTSDASQGRAALDYGIRGATFGFGNKLANAAGALGASMVTGEPYSALYDEATNNQKGRMDAELQQNPKTAIGSELAGGLGAGGAIAGTAAGGALASGIGRGLLPGATGVLGKGANLLTKMGVSGATGAASGALYGAGTADPGQAMQGAEQGATSSGLIGAVIPGAGAVLGSIKNAVLPLANDVTKGLAKKALDYGIPLSRTQIGDSEAAKTIASATGKIPLSGAGAFQKTQQAAFNKQVLSTIGADSEKATPEIIANSYKNISNSFDNALKGQNITVTPDAINKLMDIKSAAEDSLSPDDFNIVKKQIDKLSDLFTPQKSVSELLGVANTESTIPGEKLGSIRSDLSKMSKGQGNSKPYLGQLKNLVQDVSVAGAPERKEQLQDAIQKFRNYQILKPLLNKAVTGDISPSLLLNRVATNYSNFAQGGGGKLGDLARIGQAFLKDPIPNSGTAQREAVYKGLGALGAGLSGVAAPGIIAPALGGMAAARGLNTLNNSQALVRHAIQAKSKSSLATLLPNLLANQRQLTQGNQ